MGLYIGKYALSHNRRICYTFLSYQISGKIVLLGMSLAFSIEL